MTIHLLSYNNYYNRTLKKLETYTEYEPYILESFEEINFNPNDGIHTELILNYLGDTPDYIVAEDPALNKIVSRWFVINAERTRSQQYRLVLYRDTLADYSEEISNAPMFVEKGKPTANSPYIYLRESFESNEIKQEEYLLKDKTNCPWVIGYLTKNAATTPINGSINMLGNAEGAVQLGSRLEDWFFYKYIRTLDGASTGNPTLYSVPSGYRFINKDVAFDGVHRTLYTLGSNGDGETTVSRTPFEADSTPNPLFSLNNSNLQKIQTAFKNYGLTSLENQSKAYMTDVLTEAQLEELSNFRNQKVVTSDGKIYKISYLSFPPFLYSKAFSIQYSSALGITLGNLYRNSGAFNYYNNNMDYIVEIRADEIYIDVERLYDEEYSYTISDTRVKTADSPYDIIAIPAGNVTIKDTMDNIICETNGSLALPTIMSLQKEEQTFCLDIQLLPYCPVNNLINDDGSITMPSDRYYSAIKKGDEVLGVILHSPNSSFSFTINKKIEFPSSIIERKIVNQCYKYRLTSPNYSNYFDFNLARNGTINYFEIDCQYKPYSPYIHIVPQFGLLYGGDFNDPRGLVLGGDFSLSQSTDQWKQFEINNKNYQLSFDRQVQSLELQQSVERESQAWNILIGGIQGGISGATTGALSGAGAYGAAFGALAGTGISMLGGYKDYELNEKLRQDALDLTKTQHDYQLKNIRALPITLSKISSFNPNNKVFPVLEIYSCLPEEIELFVLKLAYEGISIGGISTFEKHLGNDWEYGEGDSKISSKGFIKGQIIQIPLLSADTHLTRVIAEELSKGIYTIS